MAPHTLPITPADVDSGVVNVVIGLAPLTPCESIVLDLQQAVAVG